MNASLAGDAYDAAITALASDRRARSAFQALVLASAPAGGVLYDFGAGTGIDARFYADCGYTVRAYDADPRMRHCFAIRCHDHIESGRITLDSGSYAEFLSHPSLDAGFHADLIVANFAPLNLVENLPELFNRFHSFLAPGGSVIASVLSPYYVGELRYGWWWRNLPGLCRTGSHPVPGAGCPTVRRRLGAYASQCAPHFILDRVYRGIPGRSGAAPIGIEFQRSAHLSWLPMTRCRYMFVQFRRAAGIPSSPQSLSKCSAV